MVSVVDIIFLTVLVAFIVTRLYSVFGSHSGEEKMQIVIRPLDKEAEKDLLKVLEGGASDAKKNIDEADAQENLSEQDRLLAQIPSFNKESFLKSACRVFEMVVQAFSNGNIESVKSLLSKKVGDALGASLAFRHENNLTSEVDFICFEKSEIKNVKLLKNTVKIAVEFVSQQVNILRNAQGDIIEGDENFVQKITDVWTFERSLYAKNNNWVLVSTKKSI